MYVIIDYCEQGEVTMTEQPIQQPIIKRVKVLVKRPVAPSPTGVVPNTVQRPASPQPAGIRPATPVARPVVSQQQNTQAPIARPVSPRPMSPTSGTTPSQSVPNSRIAQAYQTIQQPAQPVQPAQRPIPQGISQAPARQAVPTIPADSTTYRFVNGRVVRPLHYEVPVNIMDRIEARKTIPEKMFLLFVYAQTLARQNAERDGYRFPELCIELPTDTLDAAALVQNIDEDVYEAVLHDFIAISPFIPGLERIMHATETPIDELIDIELDRIGDAERLSSSQQIVLCFLMLLADMQTVQQKIQLHEIKKEQDRQIEHIHSIQTEDARERAIFAKAIRDRGFPVDADLLVRNYMTLSKKDPKKAYQVLITNPLYFAPIQMEKLPKTMFGFKKPGPKEAIAINKKLASFLKGLKC